MILRMFALMVEFALSIGTFPDRKKPNQQAFAAVYPRLAQNATVTSAVADLRRSRVARTPELEERILEYDTEDPVISTRQLVATFPVGRKNV